jgi:hypothetical protein
MVVFMRHDSAEICGFRYGLALGIGNIVQAVQKVHALGKRAKAANALIDFQSEETARELGVFVKILVMTSRSRNSKPTSSFYADCRAVLMLYRRWCTFFPSRALW